MNEIEILKELHREEFNKLIKMDIYKIARKLQILYRKEEILKSLDLYDNKLIGLLPKTMSNKIEVLRTEDQFSDYIGTWGNLNPRKESDRLMDKEVFEIRKEKAEAEAKIEAKNNSEIREWYYIFAKVKKIEELLAKEGIAAELNNDGAIVWIDKKYK